MSARINAMLRLSAFMPGLLAMLVNAVLPLAYCEPEHKDVSLRMALEASSIEGLLFDTRIVAGEADFKFHLDYPLPSHNEACIDTVPFAGMCLQAPYLSLGTVQAKGLAAFIYRPASALPQLIGQSTTPLATDNPKYARYLGMSLGESLGAFMMTRMLPRKIVDPGSAAYGLFLTPFKGPVSCIAMTHKECSKPSGPSWYEPGGPPTDRIFGGISAYYKWSLWSAAAATAYCAAFPGQDAAVYRLEARAALGRLHLAGEATAVAGTWHGPDGVEREPGKILHAELRYSQRFIATAIGCRYIVMDAKAIQTGLPTGSHSDESLSNEEAADTSSRYTASLEARGLWGLARVNSNMTSALPDSPIVFELDTSLEPALLPFLSLATSWKTIDGHSSRFDMLAAIGCGERLRLCVDAGMRLEPEGYKARARLSCTLKQESLSVSASISSEGWIAIEPAWYKGLEYALILETIRP